MCIFRIEFRLGYFELCMLGKGLVCGSIESIVTRGISIVAVENRLLGHFGLVEGGHFFQVALDRGRIHP